MPAEDWKNMTAEDRFDDEVIEDAVDDYIECDRFFNRIAKVFCVGAAVIVLLIAIRCSFAASGPRFDPLDFDRDGCVYSSDLVAFRAAFAVGDQKADFNGDGFVTGDDFDGYSSELAAAVTGWADLRPSVDSVVLYVATWGSDSAAGTSPAAPLRTVNTAMSRMRPGFPDWVLLERGGAWDEALSEAGRSRQIRGRSAQEPAVVSAWGPLSAERPVLRCRARSGLDCSGGEVNHVVLQSLEFSAYDRPEGDQSSGIALIGTRTDGFTVSDCLIGGFKDNVNVQGSGWESTIRGFRFERSASVDAYTVNKDTSGHSQGVFFIYADVEVSESVIDRCGWRDDSDPKTMSTMFSHDFYGNVGGSLRIYSSIVSSASSHGINANGELVARDCLVLGCPIGVHFRPSGTTSVERVAVFWSRDIAGAPRAFGFLLNTTWPAAWPAGSASVSDCLVAEQRSTGGQAAYVVTCTADGTESEVTLRGLKAWRWGDSSIDLAGTRPDDILSVSGSQMVGVGDPLPVGWEPRTPDSYAASVGLVDGADLVRAARANRRGAWNPAATGRAASECILAGYRSR